MYQGPCVYLLTGNKNYIGSTNNLARRIIEHKRGEYSTKRIGYWEVIGYIPTENLLVARKLERKIKNLGHYKENMIKLGMLRVEQVG